MKLNRVLVVEAEDSTRQLFCSMLECMGYSCRWAKDRKSAICHLEQYPADIIIVDDHMPELDGLQFLQELSLLKNIGSPTIVLLVDRNDKDFEDHATKLGAHYVFCKTADMQELLTVITPTNK